MASRIAKSPGIPVLSARSKRKLPVVPNSKLSAASEHHKTHVKFNPETVEISIGGTEHVESIKPASELLHFSFDKASSDESTTANESNTSTISDDKTCSFSTGSQSSENSVRDTISFWNNDKAYNNANFLTPVKEPRKTFEMSRLDFMSTPESLKSGLQTPKRRYTEGDKLLMTPECYNAVQMDISCRDHDSDEDFDNNGEDSCSVTVAVRVRPFNSRYCIV